jgi:hypothetical protein
MLLYKLKDIECSFERTQSNSKRKQAASSIINLLLKIDFKAEVIPDTNFEKLSFLLEDVKEKQLSEIESKLLKEIIRN